MEDKLIIPDHLEKLARQKGFEGKFICTLYCSLVEWLDKEHGIHVARTWYDDAVTTARWTYHIDHVFAGTDIDKALKKALKMLKLSN